MFLTDDTIAAIATPPGRGGIGVVRISGPDAPSIAASLTRCASLEPRRATLTTLRAPDDTSIDRTIVTFFPAPHSYTGDDVIEVSAHGSPVVLDAILRAAIAAGARLAEPGEFTLRAYLNGRIDLVQAEAVADLIDAVTPLQARTAFDQLEGTLTERLHAIDERLMDLIARLEASLDFPDEGYHFITRDEASSVLAQIGGAIDELLADAVRGRMIREGCTAVVVGRPNAGKSTLFNRLVGAARAIVTDVPGTTRDLLTERLDIAGIPFTLVDTAGLRDAATDPIEQEGIARARQAQAVAQVALVVLDRSQALTDDDRHVLALSANRRRVVVATKSDLPPAWDTSSLGCDAISVSGLTGEGCAALVAEIVRATDVEPSRDVAAIANVRHTTLLRRAGEAIDRARAAAAAGASEEFVLADLHEARACFDEVTGARTPDDVLRAIFERFCIGK